MSERQWIKATIAALHTATIVLIIMGALLALAVMIENAHGHDLPPHDCVPGIAKQPHPATVAYGSGPFIDDVMNRIPTPTSLHARLKRATINKRDPANWLHEASHMLNRAYTDEVRRQTKQPGCWAFYLLNGNGTAFRKPYVTLSQIAPFVNKEQRGDLYRNYFGAEARAHYNHDPLFIVDECIVIQHAMVYVLDSGSEDEYRHNKLVEAVFIMDALLDAIAEHDPKYPDYPRLVEFTNWYIARSVHLTFHYLDLEERPWK